MMRSSFFSPLMIRRTLPVELSRIHTLYWPSSLLTQAMCVPVGLCMKWSYVRRFRVRMGSGSMAISCRMCSSSA
jgi:hypothetical protein